MSDVSTADPDQLIAGMLAKFGTPPSPPNLAPFQKAKLQVGQQQSALTPPNAPQLQPIPQDVPKAQFTSAFSDAGMPMMLLAGLAGALTGQPLTSAFNNAASFMQGLQKGDTIANKQALDEFNTHVDAAKSANQSAIEQYHAAFENYNGNVEKLKSELSSIADAEGDTVLKYQIQQDQFDDAFKIIDARQRLNQQLQQHQDMLDLKISSAWGAAVYLTLKDGTHIQGRRNSITGEYQREDGQPIDRKDVQAEQKLGAAPRSAPALALQKFIQANPNASPEQVTKFAADYAEQVKAERDWGTGPLGNQTRSFSVGLYHLATLQQLSDALKNGAIPLFNSIANKWAAETGNPAPTNFNTARQIIGAEVVKAIVGAGGGGVQERLEAANHINTSLSPEAMAGAIKTTEDLMVGQLKGLKSQYERTTKNSDFEDTFLSPEAQELFKSSTAKAAPQFIDGQIYEDANGNRAMFKDGKWIPQ